jgi:transcriptional regulator with XRE-family HTH domain
MEAEQLQTTNDDLEYARLLVVLGKRIKEHRLELGWTQREIVKRSDFYESHWRLIEHGGTMSLRTLFKIANMFNVSMSDLLVGLRCKTEPKTDAGGRSVHIPSHKRGKR